MTDEQLREWAYRTGDGDVGAAVLRVLDEKLAWIRRAGLVEIQPEFVLGPIIQSTNPQPDDPVLKKFDGTYPMRSTVADFRTRGSGL